MTATEEGAYLLMNRHRWPVSKTGGSKGHALHDGSRGERHPVCHIPHRPDVLDCGPGVGIHFDGVVLIKPYTHFLQCHQMQFSHHQMHCA